MLLQTESPGVVAQSQLGAVAAEVLAFTDQMLDVDAGFDLNRETKRSRPNDLQSGPVRRSRSNASDPDQLVQLLPEIKRQCVPPIEREQHELCLRR